MARLAGCWIPQQPDEGASLALRTLAAGRRRQGKDGAGVAALPSDDRQFGSGKAEERETSHREAPEPQ